MAAYRLAPVKVTTQLRRYTFALRPGVEQSQSVSSLSDTSVEFAAVWAVSKHVRTQW